MPAIRYTLWMNLLLYQGIWFIAVLGRTPYVWIAFALLGIHLWLCTNRRRELGVLVAGSIVGLACDTTLTLNGIFQFSPTPNLLPIPLWLVAIWLAFNATLRHSLRGLSKRPAVLILLAALGAPLSYLGAERLGAVTLPLGQVQTALILAPVWAAIMAILIIITRISFANAHPAQTAE